MAVSQVLLSAPAAEIVVAVQQQRPGVRALVTSSDGELGSGPAAREIRTGVGWPGAEPGTTLSGCLE